MSTATPSPNDKVTQEHALYILRALQEVTTQVTINVGEIASRRGAKENTVYKMFKHLKKTYGLNIAITSAGYRGDKNKSTPKATAGDEEQENKGIGKPRMSTMPRKVAGMKRGRSGSDSEGGDSRPSPQKRQFFHPVWASTSGEESADDARDYLLSCDVEMH